MIAYAKAIGARIKAAWIEAGSVVGYIKARIAEPGTWKAMVPAIAAAGVLPAPWSYVAMAAGLAGLLIPEKAK